MAARLLIDGDGIWLGRLRLAQWWIKGRMAQYRLAGCTASKVYESLVDCMQDGESEVRRLLKEAGVDFE